MTFDPIRLFRRWRRIEDEARQEADLLWRRHGPEAIEMVRQTLRRADLTQRYRKVMKRVLQRLHRAT